MARVFETSSAMESTITMRGTPEACRYPADELLNMRESLPFVCLLLNKVNKQLADLGSIFRIPEEAFRRPEYFSCQTKLIANIASKQKSQQLSKRRVVESSEESEQPSLAESRTNLESHQTQWNLRRRESSDRSSQPHSAPSGIDAQQSENFQRFYRAVISPTHVRVTAGGRIVPNTRSLAPPNFDWNGEKYHFELPKQAGDFDASNSQQSAWVRSQPITTGYSPVFPSGFMPPYNFVPYGNNFHVSAIPSTVQGSTGSIDSNNVDSSQMPKFNGNIVHSSTGAMPQHVKLSPPNQFDQNRPFVFNGQIVYPVPHGYQVPPNAVPVPLGMLGNTSFLPQGSIPSTPGFPPPGCPLPLAGLPGPLIFPNGQGTMLMPNAAQQLERDSAPGPCPPVPGMVPMKEFLTSQMNALRSHEKRLENQIVNNKHQIDENSMEQQRDGVQAQIRNLEAMLELHLGQVDRAKDCSHEKSRSGGSGASVDGLKVPSMADSQTLNPKTSRQQLAPSGSSLFKQGTKSENPQVVQNFQGTTGTTRQSEGISKSRLTLAAAMAPPFQPRAQTSIPQAQLQLPSMKNNIQLASAETTQFDNLAAIEARLLSKASSDWGQPAYMPSVGMGPGPLGLSSSYSVYEQPVQGHYGTQVPGLQRSNTFHDQSTLRPTSVSYISPQAVPYLVGTLPYGLHANLANPEDFMYSRPLTHDEVRARYLYWGKAPRSFHAGLPKFDGKDFYPPSPIKESAHLSMRNIGSRSNAHPVKMPSVRQSFENLFTEPRVPEYKISASENTTSVLPTATSTSKHPIERASNRSCNALPSNTSARIGLGAISSGSTKDAGEDGTAHATFTPPRDNGHLNAVAESDFSSLFLESEVPGYKLPLPARLSLREDRASLVIGKETPTTPANPEFPNLNSSGGNSSILPIINGSGLGTPESIMGDSQSSSSTVEIHLSPQTKKRSPKVAHETSFAERVENFRNVEQQTLFLQNMLRNTPQATMVGSALSGTISSATAQGYLPQYRGSAAASLAPAMLNLPTVDRDGERLIFKDAKDAVGSISPMVVSSYLPENLPLNRDRTQRPSPTTVDGFGAESYMRYLSQKDDMDKRTVDAGLAGTTSAAGPVVSTGW